MSEQVTIEEHLAARVTAKSRIGYTARKTVHQPSQGFIILVAPPLKKSDRGCGPSEPGRGVTESSLYRHRKVAESYSVNKLTRTHCTRLTHSQAGDVGLFS